MDKKPERDHRFLSRFQIIAAVQERIELLQGRANSLCVDLTVGSEGLGTAWVI